MDTTLRTTLLSGLYDGSIIPYLGAGALADVTHGKSGQPMPATSEQLILALNGGKPMAPKLMYEFSRAAMNIELKRGRNAITRFLTDTYTDRDWTRASLHDWLMEIRPRYVIDINRDTQLLESYAGVAHTLIVGCARISGTSYRFKLYASDGSAYTPIAPEQADASAPILFKPMGCPKPHPSYIASDADYVDYITELMGGFAVPPFVKTLRRQKRYLLLGLRLTRDTERMVLSDLIHSAAESPAGWAMIADATPKERRFLERIGLELIDADWPSLLESNARPEAQEHRPISDGKTEFLAHRQ